MMVITFLPSPTGLRVSGSLCGSDLEGVFTDNDYGVPEEKP